MTLLRTGYAALLLIFATCSVVTSCFAQTSSNLPGNAKSVQSSGLTVSIAKIIVNQADVGIQFVVSNNTKARVYIEDVLHDQNQNGFLGSGAQFESSPTVVGLEQCHGDVPGCDTVSADNLNDYSYIDPGEFLSCMFTFQAESPVSPNDTLSFSMVLMAKFSTPNSDPTRAGPVNIIRFNFPFVPLS